MTQLDLIARLMLLEPPLHLFGGFAEDALLDGGVSRPHADIDVFVWLDELDLRLEQLRELGCGDAHVKFEPAQDRPLVIGVFVADAEIELVVGQRDDGGRGFFELPGRHGLRRMMLPDDAVKYPEQPLDGLLVRVLSPLTLYQVRIASGELFGGYRSKDVQAQRALRKAFFEDVPEEDLQPVYK